MVRAGENNHFVSQLCLIHSYLYPTDRIDISFNWTQIPGCSSWRCCHGHEALSLARAFAQGEGQASSRFYQSSFRFLLLLLPRPDGNGHPLPESDHSESIIPHVGVSHPPQPHWGRVVTALRRASWAIKVTWFLRVGSRLFADVLVSI